jgi:ABC-type transport system involved in multi-copper enzyme maturation permease subunit
VSTFDRFGDDARIVDRSYRPYDGPRGGVGASIKATTKHAVQRSLGLKRTAWQKVLPIVAVGIAYIPAIVFVGLAALIPKDQRPDNLLPTYSQYYGFVTAAIVIFTGFVAPEVLCTDRRTGMLGLYLASPLNRNTYLVAKAAAVGFVLAIVTTGPLLLMLVANTIIGEGPGGPHKWLLALVRILAGGFAISALHASLSMCVSSFTTRRAAASATIVLLLFASSAVVTPLVSREGAGWSPNLLVFNLFTLPFTLVAHIWGEGHKLDAPVSEVSAWVIALANLGWTLLFAFIVWWRYRKIAVTR